MSEKLRLTIVFDDPDEAGWIVARVVEVPGALSQGRSREEARANVIDALRLMLTPDDDDPRVAGGRSVPRHREISPGLVPRDLPSARHASA